MIKDSNISVIILTYNEARHIERCISSIIDMAKDIFVVDSYSTDKTCHIAESSGAKVYQNKWINPATQLNWALDHLPITTDWIFRLDADEIVTALLKKHIAEKLPQLPETITGIYINRRVHFLNQWIRHGGTYPMYIIRLFRRGKGYCEQRWVDEHLKITEGTTIRFKGHIIDDNLNNLGWWINKHNHYALLEAIELLNLKYGWIATDTISQGFNRHQDQRKRWLKTRYASLPLFVRPFIYFLWRYFLKLGFLDGRRGLVWHFLQGFWYRFLVDAKIFEIYSEGGRKAESIQNVIKESYGIHLSDITSGHCGLWPQCRSPLLTANASVADTKKTTPP